MGPKVKGLDAQSEPCPWRLIRQLKKGSRGEILLVTKIDDDKGNTKQEPLLTKGAFVVKHFYLEFSFGKEAQKQPQREFHIMTRMTHPNIVKAKAVADAAPTYNRRYYIPMELMDMGSVKDFLTAVRCSPDERKPSEEEIARFVLAVAVQVLLGLQALHIHGYLHRDVKPENILMNSSGRVKLCDFDSGFAADLKRDERSSSSTGESRTMGVGTDGYISPEIIRADGGSQYSCKTDLWSLGVTIFALLTGGPPPAVRNVLQLLVDCTDPDFRMEGYFNLDSEISAPAVRELLKILLVTDVKERADAFEALQRTDIFGELYTSSIETIQGVRELQEKFSIPVGTNAEREELAAALQVTKCSLVDGETHWTRDEMKSMRDQMRDLIYTRQKPAIAVVKSFVDTWGRAYTISV